jgi:hypothetical protein
MAIIVDPLRLSAGRALTSLPRALTLSVARWLRQQDSNLLKQPPGQDYIRSSPFTVCNICKSRAPKIDLADVFPQQEPPLANYSFTFGDGNTFSHLSKTRRVRVMGS